MPCAPGDAQLKPHVVLIYADDLGYGVLSSYGATEISTPNIDQLAAQDIGFTNGHATSVTCTPSRTVKFATNTSLAQRLADIIDIDTGAIISGEKTVEEAGEEILAYINFYKTVTDEGS